MILKAMSDSSYSWVNNAYAEENREEGETIAKKGEVGDFFDGFSASGLNAAYILVGNFPSNRNHIFPSSDFSEEVYFPPEVI
jgi:hypothetical protein